MHEIHKKMESLRNDGEPGDILCLCSAVIQFNDSAVDLSSFRNRLRCVCFHPAFFRELARHKSLREVDGITELRIALSFTQ